MSPRLNEFHQPIGDPVEGWTPRPRPSIEAIDGTFARLERLDPARHATALYAAHQLDTDGRNWTYLPIGPFESFEEYHAWLAPMAAGHDPYFVAVIDRATGRPVGVASYLRIEPAMGVIEVGHINFSPLAQRTSVATDAMFLMMRYAFQLGYRRYEWKCDDLNLPSRAAAERLGFVYEGTFRQAIMYKGRNRDTAWYSILDREFPALERGFTAWLAAANRDADGRQRQRLSECLAAARSA